MKYPISVNDCAAYIAQLRGWSVSEMLGPGQSPGHVRARREFFRLARAYTPMSMPELAHFAGQRSHSNVHHAVRKLGPLTDADRKHFEWWLARRWSDAGLPVELHPDPMSELASAD